MALLPMFSSAARRHGFRATTRRHDHKSALQGLSAPAPRSAGSNACCSAGVHRDCRNTPSGRLCACSPSPAPGRRARPCGSGFRRAPPSPTSTERRGRYKSMGANIGTPFRLVASLRPRLAGAAHHILEAGELLDADGAARVQLAGGDADLGAEAELAAVGELGRGIVQDDGAVDLAQEALGRRRVRGDDRVGVLRAVAGRCARSRRRRRRRASRR